MALDVAIHDFAGHPFQADLARRLAARGHRVLHLSAAEYLSGKGRLQREPGDPETLTFDQIDVGRPLDKYSPADRIRWERAYGRATAERLADWPGVVITCNLPLLSMPAFVRTARRTGVPWILWHQDVWSAAMADEASRRLPKPVAKPIATGFDRLEAWCTRQAGHVIAIGDAFTAVYRRWRVDPAKVSVIPNWAPLEDTVPGERDNPQAASIFAGTDASDLRLLYAGTLGRKHNPGLLVDLLVAARAAGLPAVLAVVSQGEAADDLRAVAAERPDLPITIHPFQPAELLSETLASADVLVSLLEPEAAMFSIPSKVLTYMAAGRPLIGLMPTDNPAAADIAACGGFVGAPTPEGARRAADWLTRDARDPEVRDEIGKRTRAVAEEKFNPHRITSAFEDVIVGLAAGSGR
ncbi:MAG TPA: glycosyltransferase family 4 protein [Aeromicrobium sp.]|nr:glycosyltransferase family 4 protein [Aeromicrobium sp.]